MSGRNLYPQGQMLPRNPDQGAYAAGQILPALAMARGMTPEGGGSIPSPSNMMTWEDFMRQTNPPELPLFLNHYYITAYGLT